MHFWFLQSAAEMLHFLHYPHTSNLQPGADTNICLPEASLFTGQNIPSQAFAMPTWTAENDLKLATAIITLYQVKVSNSDQTRLAAIMGDGCTAKAISHRVAKFREAAAELGLGGGATVPAVPATPKKRGRKATTDEDGDGDGVKPTPAKKQRTPKAKKNAVKVEEEDVSNHETMKKGLSDDEATKTAA